MWLRRLPRVWRFRTRRDCTSSIRRKTPRARPKPHRRKRRQYRRRACRLRRASCRASRLARPRARGGATGRRRRSADRESACSRGVQRRDSARRPVPATASSGPAKPALGQPQSEQIAERGTDTAAGAAAAVDAAGERWRPRPPAITRGHEQFRRSPWLLGRRSAPRSSVATLEPRSAPGGAWPGAQSTAQPMPGAAQRRLIVVRWPAHRVWPRTCRQRPAEERAWHRNPSGRCLRNPRRRRRQWPPTRARFSRTFKRCNRRRCPLRRCLRCGRRT